jgi:hypothetical protein
LGAPPCTTAPVHGRDTLLSSTQSLLIWKADLPAPTTARACLVAFDQRGGICVGHARPAPALRWPISTRWPRCTATFGWQTSHVPCFTEQGRHRCHESVRTTPGTHATRREGEDPRIGRETAQHRARQLRLRRRSRVDELVYEHTVLDTMPRRE